MTTDAMLAVFADFNDPGDEPPPPAEEDHSAADEIGRVREAAWTDGYLTGRRDPGRGHADRVLTAELLTALHDLDGKTADAVDAASLAVADLLVGAVIAMASDAWPAGLAERVRMVADRVKPALTVAPEFILRDDDGTERLFADIAGLTRAVEDGLSGESVTIRWRRGEATISRTSLLEDLRDAVMPLSAGLVNAQKARHPS